MLHCSACGGRLLSEWWPSAVGAVEMLNCLSCGRTTEMADVRRQYVMGQIGGLW